MYRSPNRLSCTRLFLATMALFALGNLLLGGYLRAQNVSVSGALVGNGSYATLTDAFAAINGGAQGGANISVAVLNSTNEGTGSAVLNQSASPWASLIVRPVGGAWTISGATAAGNPLIDLNGADNVSIDGLNAAGNALTIVNTTVSGTVNTSTIRLRGDATNNLITRLTINGASTVNSLTAGGTIYFADGAVATGNDNNTVSNCFIGPVGANLPCKAIYAKGSTLSATLKNSGNQILNCKIFDFSSVTFPSQGIYSTAGNSGWTISNNLLYQTAVRQVYQLHAPIHIDDNQGNTGSVISGNTIGYASATGTGRYTVQLGGTQGEFYPILVNGNASVSPYTIQSNTITAISLTEQPAGQINQNTFAAIQVLSAASNRCTVSGNLIGSTVSAGAISLACSTNGTPRIYGIYVDSPSTCDVTNNDIGGFTLSNLGNGGLLFNGIYHYSLLTSSVTRIVNNRVGFAAAPLNCSANSAQPVIRGIQTAATNDAARIIDNSVGWLSTSAANLGTGASASLIGILVSNANGTSVDSVVHNTIVALSQNAFSGAVSATGLLLSGPSGGTNVVARNQVHVINVSSSAATVTGIQALNGTGSFQNNIVRLGMNSNGISQTFGKFVGIDDVAGVNDYYHNSVYIGGTGVTGTANTFAFQSGVYVPNPHSIVNNIFWNDRSNSSGTGKHYAITFPGVGANPQGLTSDYNDLYATGSGGYIGRFNFFDHATLSAWVTNTGVDVHSFAANPVFVNAMGNTTLGDLHIAAGATPIEGSGLAVPSVTNDIDGQLRATLSPADIGADAGAFTYLDLFPALITYTPPTQTCVSTDFTFTATISDATGVPTNGPLVPRVYFRKNNGAYLSAAGTLLSGTGQNGTWSFTILAASIGGIVSGDVVNYYIIAQDLAGNVGSNPSLGLVASNVNTVTTPPSTVYAYGSAMSGTYTVGPGGNFTTITAAVNAYNAACLNGPILFSLTGTSYTSETFPITILANPQASAVNTLTIQPASGISATISGSSTSSVIQFEGADYVTINGSNTNTVNSVCPRVAASRNLTIQAGLNTPVVVNLRTNTAFNPATHNRVMNCNLSGQSSPVGVQIDGQSQGSSNADCNNYNEIVNNLMSQIGTGISSAGIGVNRRNSYNQYVQNVINCGSQGRGIAIRYEDAPIIHANKIDQANYIAMNVGYFFPPVNTDTYGDVVTSASIQYNWISTVYPSVTGSAIGIAIAATDTGTTIVANNIVTNVQGNANSTTMGVGIFYGGGTGNFKLYYNTVKVVQSGGPLYQPNPNHAIAINGSFPNVDIRDNMLGCQGYVTPEHAAIGLGYTGVTGNYANLVCDYNDFFEPYVGSTGTVGVGASYWHTLASWQAQTGADLHSVTLVPSFVGFNDFHILQANNPTIGNHGTPIPLITTDFDCELRDPLTPDIGADEFGPICSVADAGVASGSITFCGSGDATLTAAGYSAGAGSSYIWQSSPAGANTWTNTSGSNPASYQTNTLTISTDFRLRVACATNGSIDTSNVVTVTIAPVVTATLAITANPPGPICPGTSVTFTATVTNGGAAPAYQWQLNGNNVGSNSSTYASTSLVNGDSVTCTLTSNAICVTSTTVQSNLITIVGDIVPPLAICQNLSVQLDTLGNGSATAAAVDNGSSDACGIAGISLDNTAFTCAQVGANTVTLTVTDASGNTATCSATLTVLPSAMTVSATVDDHACGYQLSCAGAQDGTAHVQASAGCPGYSYLWSNGDTSATATGLGAGTATVTVTDGSGGTQVVSLNLVAPAPLQVQVVALTSACVGDTTGAADMGVTGGNDCLGYTYLWSNGQAQEDLVHVAPGSYTLSVTDAQGCVATLTVSIPAYPVPNPAFTQAGNLLSATATWASYQWLFNSSPIVGANGSSYLAAQSGNYSLQVTDTNGCVGTSTVQNITVVGLRDPFGGLSQLVLFPNPARDLAVLRPVAPIGEPVAVRISDVYGRVLAHHSLASLEADFSLGLEGLAAGTYFVRVAAAAGGSRVFRLVVE